MATIKIPSGATLSGLAKQYNTTVQDLAQTNNIADPNKIMAGANLVIPDAQPAAPATPTPTIPTTIDAATVGNTPKMTVPEPQTAPAVDPFVASLEQSRQQFQQIMDATNKATQPIQQERTALTSRLEDTLNRLTGRADRTTALEQQAGIADQTKQLQELNTQIAQKTGEFNQAAARLETNAASNGVNLGVLTGQQAAIRRQQAAEIGALTSVAQALQGNIALARQTIDRTVELEFADAEQQVKNLQTLLQVNYDNLSTAEKKAADERSFFLQKQQESIDQAKEDRKNVLNITAQAAQSGADNVTLSKMSQAKTPEEALGIGGSFLGEEARRSIEQQKFNNDLALKKFVLDEQTTKAQIANIYSEIAQRGSSGKIVVDTSGKVVLKPEEAQKINKELVANDAYKAIRKSQDSLQFLTEFEKLFDKTGATSAVFSPRQNAELKAKYNSTILNLKEFFNLGVLNGPDETILKSILPDPTNRSAALTVGSLGIYKPSTATKAGIENIKKQIESTLDDRFKSIRAQYGDYSEQSIGTLSDLSRIYVEQKSKINPQIKKMVEENPNLGYEDLANIIVQ